jgi:GNAT superfamily N-acetyltransferase
MTTSSLLAADGSVLLAYEATTRLDQPFADLARPGPAGPDAAAAAALEALSGWGVATRDTGLAGALLARGATLRRYAHVHSRDLLLNPAPAEWALASMPPGLHATAWNRPLEDVAEVLLAAYLEDHPDFEPRSGVDEAVEKDLRPYAEAGLMGPRLDASGLVEDEAGNVVAMLLVTARPGPPPDAGPWVVEIARLPARAYAGTGRALLQRALALLTAARAPALSLAVTEGNPARRLYEELGIDHAYSAATFSLP